MLSALMALFTNVLRLKKKDKLKQLNLKNPVFRCGLYIKCAHIYLTLFISSEYPTEAFFTLNCRQFNTFLVYNKKENKYGSFYHCYECLKNIYYKKPRKNTR